jgi:16S rRNA (guanine(966)-N(2))-methyltransferase RsmD
VIAGTARGRRLSTPGGRDTRPVLDRVKESWFAVIGSRVEGARVLDLYAGAGPLGIEALSRGASSCVFVESSGECVRLLRENLDAARLSERAELRPVSVAEAVGALAREGRRFDLVFCDPPFELAEGEEFWSPEGAAARAGRLLERGGLLMVRRERRRGADCGEAPRVAGLALSDRRRWGRSEVLFFEKEGDAKSSSTDQREKT